MIDTDDKLLDDIALKNVVMIIFVIKNYGKFYLQLFLEEVLYGE